MSIRSYPNNIKSLLHFDYPYIGESRDGLRDEIGAASWVKAGNVKLAGSQGPAAEIVSGTPCFGWRCLHSSATADYIYSTKTWTLNVGENYEVSLWFRPSASQAGNLFALFDGNTQVFALRMTDTLQPAVVCDTLGVNITSSTALTLNSWQCIRVQISGSSVGLYLANTLTASQNITRTQVAATSARIGGAAGFIDEFCYRTALTSSYPATPIQGKLYSEKLGGFGTGKLGNVTLSGNTTGPCSTAVLAETFGAGGVTTALKFNNIKKGAFEKFAVGDEVMAVNHNTGMFAFFNITAISGDYYYFDHIPSVSLYANNVAFIQVLHFQSLNVLQDATVFPAKTSSVSNGYVVFRVKGDCTINGRILTTGRGTARDDSTNMCHADLPDKFLCGGGGGIFIMCGGTFTAGSSARLGGTWSGLGTTQHGGAGYGGSGGGSYDGSTPGESGGVGYGGYGLKGCAGGYPGHNGEIVANIAAGSSGACLVLVAKTLSIDEAAISTGGEFGGNSHNNPGGGGGTGFCYLAAERMI